MANDILNKATRLANKAATKFRKHSPTICVVVGVGGLIGAGVAACIATRKLDAALDEPCARLNDIHEAKEGGEVPAKEINQDLAKAYVDAGVAVAKLYAPSVILAGASVASIAAGHNILKQRNLALATSLTAEMTAFKNYRGRVAEKFGEDAEREVHYGIAEATYAQTRVDEETGEEVSDGETKTVKSFDPNLLSEYARVFEEGNCEWSEDPEMNLMFLRAEQTYANNRLQANGYLFLNEVLPRLGFKTTKYGQLVGWSMKANGDGYVDFGLYDTANEGAVNFVNGNANSIILNFNCDGDILDLM